LDLAQVVSRAEEAEAELRHDGDVFLHLGVADDAAEFLDDLVELL
jgi:hypothetical protein